MSPFADSVRMSLPPVLDAEIQSCGYFPDLICDATARALSGEQVVDHLLHLEATMDEDEVHRHLTVMVRTPTRLLIIHTDETTEKGQLRAVTSIEAIPLSRVNSVTLTRVVSHPDRYGADPSSTDVETWLAVAWGAVSRVELEPATCGDPLCTADHGYTGTVTADDIVIRMSPAADGPDQVERLISFTTGLQADAAVVA